VGVKSIFDDDDAVATVVNISRRLYSTDDRSVFFYTLAVTLRVRRRRYIYDARSDQVITIPHGRLKCFTCRSTVVSESRSGWFGTSALASSFRYKTADVHYPWASVSVYNRLNACFRFTNGTIFRRDQTPRDKTYGRKVNSSNGCRYFFVIFVITSLLLAVSNRARSLLSQRATEIDRRFPITRKRSPNGLARPVPETTGRLYLVQLDDTDKRHSRAT